MRNISDESFTENRHKFHVIFFFLQFLALDEIMWEKYCRARQVTYDNVAQMIACWVTKATDTLIICNTYGNIGYANAHQLFVKLTLALVQFKSHNRFICNTVLQRTLGRHSSLFSVRFALSYVTRRIQ